MTDAYGDLIRPMDEEKLRVDFTTSQPFPHLMIPGFLTPAFAREVAASYPHFDDARDRGREFKAVNERGKVQITDPQAFPEPVRRLSAAMSSPELLRALSRVTGIADLLPDDELVGGGMHLMASGAHLDVHVDFNRIEARGLYRRLNVLLFLNESWDEQWGGELELWDESVRRREQVFTPRFNQLVLFETSESSFHGVRRVTSPADVSRLSFAGYYYTRQSPDGYTGRGHSTLFRARPDELWKGRVLMPLETARWWTKGALRRALRRLRGRSGS